MWHVTDRDQDGRDDDDPPHDLGAARDPSAYWRRRFFILGGGVAVLGLCAWLFPGGHPAAPRAQGPQVAVGSVVQGKVEKIETYGIFVQLDNVKGRGGRGFAFPTSGAEPA